MLSTDNNGIVMPVSPMYGGGNGGFGGFGGDWGWFILILLIAGGGWGNGFGGGYGADAMYPWINNGFQNAATDTALAGIQNSLVTGFASAESSAATRQMANMNQMYNLSSQLSNCCCENRLATANLGADIAREACSDRAAVSNGVRDIIANQTAGIQTILDKMCQQEIDAKNDRIADLERQLSIANFAASQTAQTAQIINDNSRQTIALEQYLNPTPIPAYIVANPNASMTTPASNG
jgi:hypothetical protein